MKSLCRLLLFVVLSFDIGAEAEAQKLRGIGYNPGPGIVHWVWPGGAPAGTTSFNPGAGDPFSGSVLDLAAFNARYGGRPVRSDGTIGMMVVDAETILGALSRALSIACEKGLDPALGSPSVYDCTPTLRELHDYAATHNDGGRSIMSAAGVGGGVIGGRPPGQPRITRWGTPAPGIVVLEWVTRTPDAFVIEVGEAPPVTVAGEIRKAEVVLPPGMGGPLQIRVRAFEGGIPGAWSLVKKLTVTPRASDPEPPPPPPPPVDDDDDSNTCTTTPPKCYLLIVKDGTATLTDTACPGGP